MRDILEIFILSLALTVVWISSMLLINFITDLVIPTADNDSLALLFLYLTCLLETIILVIYVKQLNMSRWVKYGILCMTLFILQFGLTQIETWFFLNQTTVPTQVIINTVYSGLLTSIIFAGILVVRYPTTAAYDPWRFKVTIKAWFMILVLGFIIYPMLYFSAGYFIAWQNTAIRIYYTGSPALETFASIMKSNLQHGLVYFQMGRGLVWTLFGWFILAAMAPRHWVFKGLILGLLFAILMNAQHLIPNPYMPDEVRLVHAVETGVSNFIWGLLLTLGYTKVKYP